MKKIVLALCCIAWTSLSAQTKITLNTDLGKTQINKHIYGHFAEHLGRCIYDGLYVGENNTKVAHTRGIRNDIVQALKDLKVPNLRWPGGCFADAYQWKDGIGPKENRPSMINVWWGGVTEDNSFGTHEFLDLCEQIGAEPYLAGNVGSGTVQDLIDWVNYVNHPGGSPMSELRKKNGREKPWNVKMWGVGNEAWGCGGNMNAEYYSNIYKQYATFMTSWTNDAKLFRIASGATDDDYAWTETLMKNIPHNMLSGVALHHYSVIDWNKKGPSTQFSEAQYFKIMQEAWKMDELIVRHSTIMDKYDPEKKVALIVDEWGGWYEVEPGTNPGFLYQQNTMRDAMIAGMTLNIFNNHADRVRGANLAQMVNVLQAVILTEGEKMILTPTYHVMKMYNVHQDATLLPIQLETQNYKFEGKSIPAVSASASKNESGINISLTNIDYTKSHEVTISLRGENVSKVSGQILTSGSIQDYNTFEQPEKIKVKEFTGAKLNNGVLKLTIPAHSVIVLNVK
ncbi:alpha-L-arabinofuranosidase domain protein [Leadbetterella byssophila DSM 17132]|uniref:non-reducing end alpha-L-arabinofuranosidase n=1 Tax=Leadbetterella byssophila (strain DSM 17132 / JCM 16389 / KACC 11308 / NBRC 106382 / 4M15) TaxID=649349 RepID=E4RYD9_LEAB4|nr:alpha-L-arabinofuranosidase C-terminal domain-containing protein [Leadbetterella byssophila]ADQ18175.1 alpha-L-arabinofuranosidase domain protein [Leadbetterella byssophila DSM 17132]